MFGLSIGLTVLLISCVTLACLFEFINGFHDTANAVATVIYTNTLKPTIAVVWSGIWNFLGVMFGGVAVAMGIVNLLPMEVLVDDNIYHGVAMILALLSSSILWNFGTWYLGIPASSSHALIGAVLGIGMAFYFIPGMDTHDTINWGKAQHTGLSLLLSPVLGFSVAIIIMFIFKRTIKNDYIYKEPIPGKTPPAWIRVILTLTCTMVSFFHGSNDGQKGVGLIMLILIGIVPHQFSLNEQVELMDVKRNIAKVEALSYKIDTLNLTPQEKILISDIKGLCDDISDRFQGREKVSDIAFKDRFEVRKSIIKLNKKCEQLSSIGNISLSKNEMTEVKSSLKSAKTLIEFAPTWVVVIISVSLGLGTMIGWKRIVKTIGEKIGKQHMSYAQGASAEITASLMIGLASSSGLPVSTTHVLSSGIAGTMVAKKGLKNLQKKTIQSILLAWVLTVPVTVILSGGLFLFFRWLF